MVEYREGILNPSKIPPFIKRRHHYTKHLIDRRELLGACFLLPRYVSNRHYFTYYLSLKSDTEGLVRAECNGYDLYFRYDDAGLGHEVYITGSHEPYTTDVYRSVLCQISSKVEEPIVLEIGANIGYYTLAALSGVPNAAVFAIEPVPSTAGLLRKNLKMNACFDQVDITEGAISTRDGRSRLYLSDKSNHASINTKGDSTRRSLQVKTWTIQSFMKEKELDVSAVNAVRMDLEGYESDLLLNSFGEFLDETTPPFVMNIELHPRYIDADELDSILTFFRERFELIAGYQHSIHGVLLASVTKFDDIVEQGLPWVELVLRRKR